MMAEIFIREYFCLNRYAAVCFLHLYILSVFLPPSPCGQSVVRRRYEAKLTPGCRVCYHDYTEEIPDLVHPTWHDLQLFISPSPSARWDSDPPARLSVLLHRAFCIPVYCVNERGVLCVFQNVKAWLWGLLLMCALAGSPVCSSEMVCSLPTHSHNTADAIALSVGVQEKWTSVKAHNLQCWAQLYIFVCGSCFSFFLRERIVAGRYCIRISRHAHRPPP